MKASQLIERLQALINTWGDFPVHLPYGGKVDSAFREGDSFYIQSPYTSSQAEEDKKVSPEWTQSMMSHLVEIREQLASFDIPVKPTMEDLITELTSKYHQTQEVTFTVGPMTTVAEASTGMLVIAMNGMTVVFKDEYGHLYGGVETQVPHILDWQKIEGIPGTTACSNLLLVKKGIE